MRKKDLIAQCLPVGFPSYPTFYPWVSNDDSEIPENVCYTSVTLSHPDNGTALDLCQPRSYRGAVRPFRDGTFNIIDIFFFLFCSSLC